MANSSTTNVQLALGLAQRTSAVFADSFGPALARERLTPWQDDQDHNS